MCMFQVFPNALRKSIDILHSASEEGGRATVAGERCGACGERMHCISPWDIVHLASGYGASRKVGGRARELDTEPPGRWAGGRVSFIPWGGSSGTCRRLCH